jgi:hypothetical protein
MAFDSPDDGAGNVGVASDAVAEAWVRYLGQSRLPAHLAYLSLNMAFARFQQRAQGEGRITVFLSLHLYFFLFSSLRFFMSSFTLLNSDFCFL